jgi:hypothetical protein
MDEIDDILTCPITMVVMEEPVISEDGNTYERSTITEWMKKEWNIPTNTRENEFSFRSQHGNPKND